MDEINRPTLSNGVESLKVETIKNYFLRQTALAAAFLFGSFAQGRARRTSDVDLAVLYARMSKDNYARFKDRLRMEEELEEICHRRVQVVDLEAASPVLQRQVRKYGQVLVEMDHRRRVEFEVRSRRNFLEMQGALSLHTEKHLQRLGD